MWGDIIIAFLLAFITAFMITPKTIKLAKKLGAVDNPKDERRISGFCQSWQSAQFAPRISLSVIKQQNNYRNN